MATSTTYVLNFCLLGLVAYVLLMPRQEPAAPDLAATVAELGTEVQQLRILLKCNKLLEEKRKAKQ